MSSTSNLSEIANTHTITIPKRTYAGISSFEKMQASRKSESRIQIIQDPSSSQVVEQRKLFIFLRSGSKGGFLAFIDPEELFRHYCTYHTAAVQCMHV